MISVKIKKMDIRIFRIFCLLVPEYVRMYVYRVFWFFVCVCFFFNLKYIEIQGMIAGVGHMKY